MAARRTREQKYRLGVGIMLINRDEQVFVAHRLDIPGDTWQMPQGGIDDGEEPDAAALRELKEEIGTDKAEIIAESKGWLQYRLPRELIGHAWGGRWQGQRQKWFIMRFLGRDEDINLATEHAEFDAWKWVPIARLPDIVVSFKRQVYLNLLAEFQELSEQTIANLLADPVLHMLMVADGVNETDLHSLLQRVARNLRDRER